MNIGYLAIASQFILDVNSLALNTFSSSNRGDKCTGILGIMQQGRLGKKEKGFK